MIHKDRCIILDIDGTLCPIKSDHQKYEDLRPIPEILEKLREYKERGFYVVLYTARNMRTYDGNIGKIMANTAKVILDWLDNYNVPYDEIHFGKPWTGKGGFYVDDKAIRPSEFLKLSYKEILELIGDE